MGNALKKVVIPMIGLGSYWYRQERCQIHVKLETEDEEVRISISQFHLVRNLGSIESDFFTNCTMLIVITDV